MCVICAKAGAGRISISKRILKSWSGSARAWTSGRKKTVQKNIDNTMLRKENGQWSPDRRRKSHNDRGFRGRAGGRQRGGTKMEFKSLAHVAEDLTHQKFERRKVRHGPILKTQNSSA